ncbi:hypothetical protein Taro_045963 [Colocasia esculenta]|uniref:Uncharacterized protein n=1 Tax=Colocasia esculenta TaxID=4460 RepID=A0A843X3I0_COLES|nr:hypothetical protein [Colocasia esculenta]
MGKFPSGDQGVLAPAGSCGVVERHRGVRRRCPSIVKALHCHQFGAVLVVLAPLFARCLELEGLSRSEVVSVAWDPHPREPVEGVLWATSVLELAADWADSGAEGKTRLASPLSHCLALRWFQSRVGRSGVRPLLGKAAVLHVLCVSMAALSHPSMGAEAGARLACRACGLRVPLLAASGGGLVAAVVTTLPHDTHASGGFRFSVLSVPWSRSWVTFRGDIGVCGFPTLWHVHGLGWLFLWALDLVETISSNSSGFLDPWVAMQPSGSLAGVREVGSLQWYQTEKPTEICVQLPCMIRARAAGCSCCCAACLASVVAPRVRAVAARLALDSLAMVFLVWRTLAGKSRCSVCRVASLVEHCNTFLWLLSAWCWLVVSSGEVLLELRCIAWLPCVPVRFPRTVCCCPGEGFSQDYFALISTVVVLPQSLRCAVGLAGAFWRVFLERRLGGSGGGSPRTCLRCFCSSACCSVLSDGLCCLVVGLCILVKALPRIALCRFWWRFFPGVLCVCFGPPLLFKALRFPPLGHFVLAYALWLYRCRCGVAALPCLGSPISGPFEVGVLSSTSVVVSVPVWLEVPLRRSRRGGVGGLVRSGGGASWSEEEVAERREDPSRVRFFAKGRDFLCPSRSGWIGSPSRLTCVSDSNIDCHQQQVNGNILVDNSRLTSTLTAVKDELNVHFVAIYWG